MGILQSIKRMFGRAQSPLDPPITFDQNGFYRTEPLLLVVPWSTIVLITGYKIDLFTVDEIRIEFGLANGTAVVITEEILGFGALMEEIVKRFPSVAGWHAKIAYPAFAPSTAVLFEATKQPSPR